MKKQTIITAALLICFLLSINSHAKSNDNPGNLTISITKLDVTDKSLELSWEIRNDSEQDAWILTGLTRSGEGAGASISAFIGEDGQTLLMRRRLDQPWIGNTPFPACNGRYIRLRAGQIITNSVSLAIPIWPVHDQVLVGSTYIRDFDSKQLTRLVIELGYYTGDFPHTVHRVIEQDEKNPRIVPSVDPSLTRSITEWFGGLRGFNNLNELLNWRDDEVLIPYTSQAFSGERFLHTTVDNLNIPCEKERGGARPLDFDFSTCTRIEIQYQPSTLEYFFPYDRQQNLLSPSEKEYLHSMKTFVVENQDNLKILADELNKGKQAAGIVLQRNVACLTCYHDNERLMSFSIYNDNSIVTEGRYRFEYPNGLESLRKLTPQVQQIHLRVNCASNLKHLWNRFCLYQKIVKPGFFRRRKISYPAPENWCSSMLSAYNITEKNNEYIMRPYKCPSAGYGECHYAMNPNCKPDSPSDMVLLFETKPGWNQHGGPELFTYDNHDPKGGCVLLNDGTVKFIRTKEELHQLRWK